MTQFHSREYVAVRHILTSPAVAARSAAHIRDSDFDWAGLLAEAPTMSSGQQLLVRAASSLWHADGTVGMWELARKLDPSSFRRVVDALEVCRGEPQAAALSEAA
jgi:hypothetical protein